MTPAVTLNTDPALDGLRHRASGSPCDTRDHEGHDPYYCDQIALGRDVSEYRPEVRRRHTLAAMAAR